MTDQSPVSVERIRELREAYSLPPRMAFTHTIIAICDELLRLRSEREQQQSAATGPYSGKPVAVVTPEPRRIQDLASAREVEVSAAPSSSPDEYKMGAGERRYPHLPYCNATDKKPLGCDMCSCYRELTCLERTSREPCEWVMPSELAQKLLRIRDALTAQNYDEAYHVLYSIASPKFDVIAPWDKLIEIAYPAPYNPTGEAKPNGDGK